MAADDVAGVAALADPVRRRLYEHVVSHPEPVSRDDAATAAGIKRPLAAFHLDKLVEEGLLDVEFRRLSGKSGPGAGRPSKLYRRSQRQFDVTLPPREYDLAGRMLAEAVQQAAASGDDVSRIVNDVAFKRGAALAATGTSDPLEALVATLRDHGYEPRIEDGVVVLANCPFHELSRDYTQLVCGMNLALCRGVSDAVGLKDSGFEARLDPQEGRCCVTFVRRDDTPRRRSKTSRT